MANVHDVAAYILEKHGPMSAMKLQKLVYYSQAWALAWIDAPIFPERIEAWASGPVVRELYECHRGQFQLGRESIQGNPDNLNAEERDVIDRILAYYGDKSPQWLSDLTHMEAPWSQARKGLQPGERGTEEISLDSIQEYYSNLTAQ